MAVALAIPGSAGIVGSDLVWWLRYLLGAGAWSLPCLLTLWGISHVQERPPRVGLDVRIGSALLFVSYLAWWHLVGVSRDEYLTSAVFQEHSGILGAALGTALRVTLGEIGGL
ncbi:MAG TPA: DNA translocase FtsK 4TM domain-containing protein, partial [Armatimonadota bacterium]